MKWVDLVGSLALLQFMYFGILVGKARSTYQVKAPATTGNEMFERIYRVQMNTVELLVAFIPALMLAAKYWNPNVIAVLGAVYLVGRLVYLKAYTTDPSSRTVGFLLSFVPIALLILAVIVGSLIS